MKNNFCSFALPPNRVIERFPPFFDLPALLAPALAAPPVAAPAVAAAAANDVTCSTPTPLKIASTGPDPEDRTKNITTYSCQPDSEAYALKVFQDGCKQNRKSYTPPPTCPNPQTFTTTDAITNKEITFYACSGMC